jgi:ribonuclease HI
VIEVEKDGETELIDEIAETIGVASNNVAEYRAIIRGLEEAERLGASSVTCILDSELVVEQLNGNYRVKSEDMKPLHSRVQELRLRFAQVSFGHVRREQNEEADRLVNAALDGKPVIRPGVDAPAEAHIGAASVGIVEPAPSSDWTPLKRPGSRGVQGKLLVRSNDLTMTMLRFGKRASIDDRSADGDTTGGGSAASDTPGGGSAAGDTPGGGSGGETYVVCMEGKGHVRVGSIEANLSVGQWSRWPAGANHRLWTTDTTMVTLMVELEPMTAVRRGRG